MRDIKKITSSRKDFRSRFTNWRKKSPQNSYKFPTEGKPSQRRLRFLLPVVALLLAAYPVASLLFSTKPAQSSIKKAAPQPASLLPALDPFQSFQIAADSLPAVRVAGNQMQAPLPDGGTVTYAINDELQERVKHVMQVNRVPYGAFVAIEPKTGRILALAGFSANDPAWEKRSCFGLYPMASLFKIVTATAALEANKVTPDTVFAYRGKLTSVNPKYWFVKPGRQNPEMSLSTAMGKSVNPVFGRLASDVVGRESMMSIVDRFGFNQLLLPGTWLPASKAESPQTDAELKLMGAGLGREVKVSPFHVALMMAAIANNGVMMLPSLAQEIRNGKGETVYTMKPQTARRIISSEAAGQLTKMLSTTVNTGTSRKAFHDRRGRPKFASIDIAAKTGSIDGKDPVGHYNWFAAYAPINDPCIAVVALVINQDKWKIKASYLGEQALEAFFR